MALLVAEKMNLARFLEMTKGKIIIPYNRWGHYVAFLGETRFVLTGQHVPIEGDLKDNPDTTVVVIFRHTLANFPIEVQVRSKDGVPVTIRCFPTIHTFFSFHEVGDINDFANRVFVDTDLFYDYDLHEIIVDKYGLKESFQQIVGNFDFAKIGQEIDRIKKYLLESLNMRLTDLCEEYRFREKFEMNPLKLHIDIPLWADISSRVEKLMKEDAIPIDKVASRVSNVVNETASNAVKEQGLETRYVEQNKETVLQVVNDQMYGDSSPTREILICCESGESGGKGAIYSWSPVEREKVTRVYLKRNHGNLRSVRVQIINQQKFVLVGSTSGVICLDQMYRTMADCKLPQVEEDGINSSVILGNSLYASHAKGVFKWNLDDPDSLSSPILCWKHLFDHQNFHPRGIRQFGGGSIIFSSFNKIFVVNPHEENEITTYESNQEDEIIGYDFDDQYVYAITREEPEIIRWEIGNPRNPTIERVPADLRLAYSLKYISVGGKGYLVIGAGAGTLNVCSARQLSLMTVYSTGTHSNILIAGGTTEYIFATTRDMKTLHIWKLETPETPFISLTSTSDGYFEGLKIFDVIGVE